MRTWIRDHPLLSFCIITFGWTWAWDGVFIAFDLWGTLQVSIPRVWGPAIAAIVVIWASDVPLRRWFHQRLHWRISPWFMLIALIVPLFITNIQPIVEAIGGGEVEYVFPGPLYLAIIFVVVNMFFLGGSEELGWRGIAQPRLQKHMSVATASLIIGALWWAWHLPLFFVGHPAYPLEVTHVITYTVFILGASLVFGAFVNLTDGYLLPLMLMHATANLGAFISADGGLLEGSPLVPLLVGAGLWWIIAGVLIARYGLSMSSNADLAPITVRRGGPRDDQSTH